jgi:predicted nucleic acid-binding protein
MAQIVIDASVVVAVTLGTAGRPALIEAAKGSELLAAASLPWQVGSGLLVLMGRGRVSVAEATKAAAASRQIAVRLVEVDLGEAPGLAARLGISAYDAYTVACARRAHCPLLTLDPELAKAARAEGIPVMEAGS